MTGKNKVFSRCEKRKSFVNVSFHCFKPLLTGKMLHDENCGLEKEVTERKKIKVITKTPTWLYLENKY